MFCGVPHHNISITIKLICKNQPIVSKIKVKIFLLKLTVLHILVVLFNSGAMEVSEANELILC